MAEKIIADLHVRNNVAYLVKKTCECGPVSKTARGSGWKFSYCASRARLRFVTSSFSTIT